MCAERRISRIRSAVLIGAVASGATDATDIPSLDVAWSLAEKGSAPMRAANAQELLARADHRADGVKTWIPSVSGGVSYTDDLQTATTDLSGAFLGRRDTTLEMRIGRKYAASAYLQAQWNVVDLSRWAQVRASGSEVRLARRGTDRTRSDLRAQVADLYYLALARRDAAVWASRGLDLSDSGLAIAQARFREGKLRPAQLRAAQDQREEAYVRFRHGEVLAEEARRNLASLLELPEGEPVVLEEVLPSDPVVPSDSTFPDSPELAQARSQVELSRDRLGAARATLLPVLSATWQGLRQVQSDEFADLSPEAKPQQVVGARIEVPLLAGGDRALAIRKASIQLELDRRNLEGLRRRQAVADRELVLELGDACERSLASQHAMERREADENDARELFGAGAISLEELMKTSSDLIQSRILAATDLSAYLADAAKVRVRREGGRP